MMSVTASPASLLQALMGTDSAATPEQPAANAAQFAALIAGLGVVPKTGEVEATGDTDTVEAKDQAGDDLMADDGKADPQSGEDDPLAAALAMLPTAMQQAMVAPPPVSASEGDAAPQPMQNISLAAMAHTRPANDDPEDKVTTTDTADPPSTPLVLSEVEGRDLDVALVARASTALSASGSDGAGVAGVAAEAQTPLPAPVSIGVQNAVPPPPVVATQAAQLSARTDAPRTAEAPSARPFKRKSDDAAIAALGSTDTAATSLATVPQATTSTADVGTTTAKLADPQTPIAQALANQHLKISSDGQWLDQLARDIARTASGDGKLSFHLNPEHLGSLQVEVTRGPEGASVRLTADTDAARTILIDAQPRLQAEARAQGVKIAETHVDLGGQNAGQGALGQGARQQAQPQPEPLLRAIGAGDVAGAARTTNNTAAAVAAAERFA